MLQQSGRYQRCVFFKQKRFRFTKYLRFQNEYNKVQIELRVVQFWTEIKLVITNRTPASRSGNFVITPLISVKIARYSVQLPLLINCQVYRRVLQIKHICWAKRKTSAEFYIPRLVLNRGRLHKPSILNLWPAVLNRAKATSKTPVRF
jgi:hypothetical protein